MSFKSGVAAATHKKYIVPKGWSTIDMVAKDLGTTVSGARKSIERLLEARAVELRRVMLVGKAGQPRMHTVYRMSL